MKGIIGKKIGMTSIFNDQGKSIPCTMIEAGPCVVTQVKSPDTDGYSALQISFDDKKEKNTPNALLQHFKKAGTAPKRKVVEVRDCELERKLGENITVDIFNEGDFVDVVGTSKGKGFQGVMKRHGFHGVGGSTHGQKDRNRAPGSIGAASYPARVFKGMRMAGRKGNDRIKTQNLSVLKIVPEDNLLIVKGNVPGHNGAYVFIEG